MAVNWTVWNERNHRVFENVEVSVNVLMESSIRSLFFWCREWIPMGVNPIVELEERLSIC